MGLFGFGKNKESPAGNASSSINSAMNNDLFKNLTQATAILLTKMGVTSQLALKSMSPDVYIKVCGMHMVGSGMYVCYMQEKLKKSAADFSLDEIKGIATAWQSKDAYELALNTFGIPVQSQQKMSLDQIYVYGLGVYKSSVGSAWDKKENLCAYMKVMYNAGFTLAMNELR